MNQMIFQSMVPVLFQNNKSNKSTWNESICRKEEFSFWTSQVWTLEYIWYCNKLFRIQNFIHSARIQKIPVNGFRQNM